ncbi:hypothetical protein ACFVHQ_09235 [Actinomycetes bacterium NPDC127524]
MIKFFKRKKTASSIYDEKIDSLEATLKNIEQYLFQLSSNKGPPILKQQVSIRHENLGRQEHKTEQHIQPPPINTEDSLGASAGSPIKIESLRVDKIIVEKLEYSNNFGQLGINELTGKLNIGASYEGKLKKMPEFSMAKFASKDDDEKAPEVKLHSRKEE